MHKIHVKIESPVSYEIGDLVHLTTDRRDDEGILEFVQEGPYLASVTEAVHSAMLNDCVSKDGKMDAPNEFVITVTNKRLFDGRTEVSTVEVPATDTCQMRKHCMDQYNSWTPAAQVDFIIASVQEAVEEELMKLVHLCDINYHSLPANVKAWVECGVDGEIVTQDFPERLDDELGNLNE